VIHGCRRVSTPALARGGGSPASPGGRRGAYPGPLRPERSRTRVVPRVAHMQADHLLQGGEWNLLPLHEVEVHRVTAPVLESVSVQKDGRHGG
jgi:hypothetical protein